MGGGHGSERLTQRDLDLVAYLGPVADAVAEQVVPRLEASLGVGIRFDPDAPGSERWNAIVRGGASIMWMCGYITRRLVDSGRLEVEIVAAPVAPAEEGPVYHSVIVARDAETLHDLAGTRCVINEVDSWSGCHALGAHIAGAGLPLPYFSEVIESGGHAASLEILRAGGGDCAAIDSTVWNRVPDAARHGLRVVGRTRDWPAPPFSLSRRIGPDERRRITTALTALEGSELGANFDGIVPVNSSVYDEMANHTTVRLA